MTQITNVITLAEYANKYELDAKRIRRIARKNEWPDPDNVPFKFGTVWAIDANAPPITLPTKSARGARRADGRQRYIVFVDATDKFELSAIANIVGDDNIIDPRVVARERRATRKLADAETGDKSEYFDAVGELYAAHDAELENDDNE